MKKYKWLLAIILVASVVSFFFKTIMSAICIDFFLMIDNALEFNKLINPIIMWVILGLFIGLVYGTLTAWKKYRIDFKLNYIFIMPLFLFITLVSFVNKPITPKGTTFQPIEPLEPVTIVQKFATVTQNTSLFLNHQTNSPVSISSVTMGSKIEIIETRDDEWCRVKLNDKIGFIMKKNLSLNNAHL